MEKNESDVLIQRQRFIIFSPIFIEHFTKVHWYDIKCLPFVWSSAREGNKAIESWKIEKHKKSFGELKLRAIHHVLRFKIHTRLGVKKSKQKNFNYIFD